MRQDSYFGLLFSCQSVSQFSLFFFSLPMTDSSTPPHSPVCSLLYRLPSVVEKQQANGKPQYVDDSFLNVPSLRRSCSSFSLRHRFRGPATFAKHASIRSSSPVASESSSSCVTDSSTEESECADDVSVESIHFVLSPSSSHFFFF